MSDEPASPRDEVFIALVGPIASLVLAAIFFAVHNAAAAMNLGVAVDGLMRYLAMINLLLAIFNLMPAFPLDGGRVLRAVLWKWKGNLRRATRTAAAIGGGFGIFLIVLGVLQVLGGSFVGGMWLFLIGLFIRSAANMSYQHLQIRRALQGEPLRRFMTPNPVTAKPSMTLRDLVENHVYRYHHKLFPVVDDDDHLRGCVTTRQIKSVDREQWKTTAVDQLIEPCGRENTIDADTDAVQALSLMRQNNASRLMVSEGDRLVGIISLKDMLDFLSMKIELEGEG
jgi:CBS domain-containing protein